MDDKNISYIVFETEMARHERTIKRLLVALVAAIALLFISNIAWLWFFNQFDYAINTITQGTEDGDNSYINANGTVINGTTDGN